MPNRKSLYAYVISVIVILYISFIFFPRYKQSNSQAAIAWDVAGYYWPLPSFFIYNDAIHQQFADSIVQEYHPSDDLSHTLHFTENGKDVHIFRYSFGTTVSYIPGFAIAHLSAKALGYKADGFSRPYQFAIQLGGCIWVFIGLWYTRKLFLKYYSDSTVCILLLILCIGTNYLNYAAIDNGMSHTWLFTLYVLLILNSISFYERGRYKDALGVGVLIGLITLTRPPEIISCMIPVLWGINSLRFAEIKNRVKYLLSHFKHLLIAGIVAGAIISVQFIYWKMVGGYWIMDTYFGQKFNFSNPYFMEYMFSYKSGWLVYTPMMFLVFIGLIFFLKDGKNRPVVVLFFAVSLYIVASWEQWWYAGSGGRAMIQSYPVLLFPLASCIEFMWKRHVTRWPFLAVVLLFSYANIWFTYNAHVGGLYDSESMNKDYYWRVIGKFSAPRDIEKVKDYDEYYEGTPKNMKLLYSNNFESDTSLHNTTKVIEGRMSYTMDAVRKSSGWFVLPLSAVKADRLRVQATYFTPSKEWNIYQMSQLLVRMYSKGNISKEKYILVDRHLDDGVAKNIYIDLKIPEGTDSAAVSFWGPNIVKPLFVDDLKMWSFDE